MPEMDQELDVALLASNGGRCRRHAAQSYLSARGGDFREDARVNRRVPDNALLDFCAPGFELRFDERNDVRAWTKHGSHNWKDLPQRDE